MVSIDRTPCPNTLNTTGTSTSPAAIIYVRCVFNERGAASTLSLPPYMPVVIHRRPAYSQDLTRHRLSARLCPPPCTLSITGGFSGGSDEDTSLGLPLSGRGLGPL